MEYRVWKSKLLLIYHITHLDESSLANEIYKTQKRMKFPGLVTECQEICKELNIIDITDDSKAGKLSKQQWKRVVKEAIHQHCEKKLKDDMQLYSKLRDSPMIDETFERQTYLKELNLADARIKFSLRSSMVNCKMNYRSDGENMATLWKCSSCETFIDSQAHLKWCPAYADLRAGKDINCDKDLIEYIGKVMFIRDKLRLNK